MTLSLHRINLTIVYLQTLDPKTMTTVHIGLSSRELDDATSRWVADEINTRNRDRATYCIKVRVDEQDAQVTVGTAACGFGGGGGAAPRFNELEQKIIELFEQHVRLHSSVQPVHLISFLQRLRGLLGYRSAAA